MKRYLVFAFDHYYPCGGWNDFVESFDTMAEVEAAHAAERFKGNDCVQVVDSQTGVATGLSRQKR